MAETKRAQRVGQYTLLAVLGASVSCALRPPELPAGADSALIPEPAAEARGGSGPVRLGIDVLLASEEALASLRGKRVGLITNHTGLTSTGETTVDALHRHEQIDLVALFGPEHGIRGTAEAGEKVAGGVDARTGLPVHSLYGDTRKPTEEMLRGLDALVFDIQDIGTRYYTYIWTMALALQAAAEHKLRFVVLDRPNPIGGEHMHGNVLEPAQASFVGLYPVPMRHGLTVGEMARFLNAEHGIGADLVVIPAEGWRRSLWWDATGLAWTAPSPNMRSLEAATHYPGTCLFEPTNLSVGRGTPDAFQHVGAPWLDHEELVRRLNAYGLPGVRFEATTFTPANPGDGMYGGQLVKAIRFVTTDRSVYDPALAGTAALVEVRRRHPDQFTIKGPGHMDRLAGTPKFREEILAGKSAAEITAGWAAQLAEFRRKAEPHLLYR